MSSMSAANIRWIRHSDRLTNKQTKLIAAWCLASQAFRSALQSSWRPFSRGYNTRREIMRRFATGNTQQQLKICRRIYGNGANTGSTRSGANEGGPDF